MICLSTLTFGQALQLTSQTQFSSQNSLPSLSPLESSTCSLLCMRHILYTCFHSAAAAKSLQSCPTLCDPIDGRPSVSSVPGILQARILEWVAISFSKTWKWKVKVKSLGRFGLLAIPWTAAYQAPPSMGFSRQEYWSGLRFPSPCLHSTLACSLGFMVSLPSWIRQVCVDSPLMSSTSSWYPFTSLPFP